MDARGERGDVVFPQVFDHLAQVEKQPTSQPFDEDLLRRAERLLDARTPRDLLWRLLSTGERLLQTVQQDPRPLTRLLERTVQLIPFDELKTSISAEKLIEGLNAPSVPVRLLCLAYIKKAADLPSGAAFVACSPDLVRTLLMVWLASNETEVAERALEDIIALLTVDSPETVTFVSSSSSSLSSPPQSGSTATTAGEATGQGLVWRRLFQDAEMYRIFFEWTSLISSKHDLQTKQGQHAATISQARLFDFITKVALLDWVAITTSVHPVIERQYSKSQGNSEQQQQQQQPYGGLLKYAANGMIDRSDFLMETLREDFFLKLLHVVEEENSRGVTPVMITAIQNGAGAQQMEEKVANGIPMR